MKSLTANQIDRRERILDAVRGKLARDGYDGLSMRELADSAHVSPTTLYNLYGGKDALILAALQDLLEQIAGDVRESGTTGIRRLLANAEATGKQIIATPGYAEAMARSLFNADPTHPICEALMGRGIEANRAALIEMQASGEVRRDADVDLFARNLTGGGWMVVLCWMKGFIALRDVPTELERSVALTLWAALTPKLSRELQREFNLGVASVAAAS